jgi:hypothetical protein
MGCGVSSTQINADIVSNRFRQEETDVERLLSDILKRSLVFEEKKSMTRSLIAEINSPLHVSYDDQFYAVNNWVKRYSDARISAYDIYCLIKHATLYEHAPNYKHLPQNDTIVRACDDVHNSENCSFVMAPHWSNMDSRSNVPRR